MTPDLHDQLTKIADSALTDFPLKTFPNKLDELDKSIKEAEKILQANNQSANNQKITDLKNEVDELYQNAKTI